MTTNVPPPTFGPTGFVIPTDDEILAGVLADFNSAFGGDLNITNLATPQGQLASSEAAIISNSDQTFLFYTTQVDPAYATGRMQDAIARIYFLTRNQAEPTTVQCTCTGLSGTVIPQGALAQDTGGNTYTCVDGGTISGGGTVTLAFANIIPGPIACPEATLTTIYQAVPGWDSITNPTDGVLGNNTESRAAFEARRAASVAGNSAGFLASILGTVLAVPGVTDAYVTENDTGSPIDIGNVTLIANSLYVAVVGGSQDAVAKAIWSKKPPGAAYNGNTNVTVYDTNALYGAGPYPSYAVTYETPSSLSILFKVTIVNSAFIPANATVLIQNAIINAFSGADGGRRATIGGNILASRFYASILAVGSWAQIESLYVGSNNTPSATFTGSVATTVLTVSAVASGTLAVGNIISDITTHLIEGTTIVNQLTGVNAASITASIASTTMTVTAVGSGALAAGQVLHATGVTGGTTIVSQLTGSAGSTGTYRVSISQTRTSTTIAADTPGTTGTYTVTNSQTVSSETMISAAIDQFNVQTEINQIPTIAAANISVNIT